MTRESGGFILKVFVLDTNKKMQNPMHPAEALHDLQPWMLMDYSNLLH